MKSFRNNGGLVSAGALTWRTDSTLASYFGEPDASAWDETRNYSYNLRGQLTNETFSPGVGQSAATAFGFDSDKLGVLTSAIQTGALTNRWQSGALDSFRRVTFETNVVRNLSLRASGQAVGAGSVTATLNNTNLPLAYTPGSADGRWYADVNLGVGTNKLIATAHHELGAFHPSATNEIRVLGTNQITSTYDGMGNMTNRVLGGGRTQTLTWDGLGRLIKVVEKTGATTNSVWTAMYDGLGRRLRSVLTPVINGTNGPALTSDSWYDPQVEFLEVAVEVNGVRTWKVYGPDLSGRYGSVQGIGGLEATVRESDGTTTGILNDYFGNAVATINNPPSTINWSRTQVNGYGPVKGFEAATLSLSVGVAEATLWRGLRLEPTGFYYLGARHYDPVAGRFISGDPMGHAGSLDLYSYAMGDPINSLAPDGRLAKQAINTAFDK